jgi:hypothetical protein
MLVSEGESWCENWMGGQGLEEDLFASIRKIFLFRMKFSGGVLHAYVRSFFILQFHGHLRSARFDRLNSKVFSS